MAPRALGLGANQITFVVATMLATGVGVGAVTSYNIAWTLMQIPLGVIGFPLGVVLLPSLSRAVASGSIREFGRMIVGSVRLMLWIMLFITTVGIVVRRQVVNMLFVGSRRARPVTDRRHAVVPASWAVRLFAGDRLCACLLQRPRHAHAGLHGAVRHDHEHRRQPRDRWHDGPVGHRPGHVVRRVRRGIGAGRPALAAHAGHRVSKRSSSHSSSSPSGRVLAAFVAAVVLRVTDPIVGPDPGRLLLLLQVASPAAPRRWSTRCTRACCASPSCSRRSISRARSSAVGGGGGGGDSDGGGIGQRRGGGDWRRSRSRSCGPFGDVEA